MEPTFTLTAFTPAEAAEITGVSQDLQRDWRRHGYLSKREGHARFDCFDLATMLTMKILADRGIGPKQSIEIADWCALGIVEMAFATSDAWEGDVDRAPVPANAVKTDKAIEALSQALPGQMRGDFLAKADARWEYKAGYLKRQLWRHLQHPRITPGRCFIWWADGSHSFAMSFDTALEDLLSSDPKTQGAMVVLDYFSLSTLLLERAKRALCHVEFVEDAE